MASLTLTKHHGLGNDFLVLLDPGDRHPVGVELARRLCDRHRGVGADGLIRVGPGRDGADVTMHLRNADGGVAETSGNGLRCLAQAVVDAGLVPGPDLTVATAAGVRRATVRAGQPPGTATVRVEMGPAKVGPDQPQEWPGRRVRAVDMGNPHLVLFGADPYEVDVPAIGAQVEAVHAGGMNVEFVAAGPQPDELTMRVWERGVGETMACGSGACAAAAAAHDWDLVGPRVVVHQPGGAARVSLEDGTVLLTGPAQHVARVEVEVDGDRGGR